MSISISHFHLPYGYQEAPAWPALYWPFTQGFDPLDIVADIHHSIYYLNIWRFTMIWSVLFSLIVYLPAGLWAFATLAKSRTFSWNILLWIPIVFVITGSIASFVVGSILGVALAFVYNAGFFVMSSWIPFLWGLIHVLAVVIGSYSTITAIL
ncbi:hypothetical protein BDF14DRAFT_1716332 [Spinellus fusiger]|nr:hypothetical protein BDF14DRAFT_1716332 [Spinellus fusiger]